MPDESKTTTPANATTPGVVADVGVKASNIGADSEEDSSNAKWSNLLKGITTVAQLAGRSIHKRVKENPYEVGGALLGAASFGLALKGAMQPEGKRKWPWYAGSAVTGLGSVASLVKSSRLNAKPLPPLDPNSMTLKNMDEIPDRPAPNASDLAAKINAGSSMFGFNLQVDVEQARKMYWTSRIFKRNRDMKMFKERMIDITKGANIHPDDLDNLMNMPLDPTKAPEFLGVYSDTLIRQEGDNARQEAENSKSVSKADIARLNEERRRKKGI